MSTTSPASYGTMKAVVLESYGTPIADHLKLTTLPIPTLPTPSHVRIRNLAVALNPIDKVICNGAMASMFGVTLPTRVGYDCAGIVESVGASVTRFKVGDAVYCRVDHDMMGTVGEYSVSSEGSFAKKPSNISFDEAASLPLVALTALQSLRDVGGLVSGQKLLITGGTGGVGSVAIQLARILGASEIVTTQSSHFDRSLQFGATKALDYKTEKWSETVKDMDLVFDTTGEANASFSTLKSGGTCVSIIAALTPQSMKDAGMEPSLTTTAYLAAAAAPVQANALLHQVTYKACLMKPSGSELEEIRLWVEEGKLKPVVDRTWKLEAFKEAFAYLEEGHAKGKIVIHIADQ